MFLDGPPLSCCLDPAKSSIQLEEWGNPPRFRSTIFHCKPFFISSFCLFQGACLPQPCLTFRHGGCSEHPLFRRPAHAYTDAAAHAEGIPQACVRRPPRTSTSIEFRKSRLNRSRTNSRTISFFARAHLNSIYLIFENRWRRPGSNPRP